MAESSISKPPTPRVLLVEEDGEVRGLLVRYLEGRGFDLAPTASVAEAKALLAHEEFGAILIDPELPNGDGLALLEDQDAPSDRVVILTTHPDLALDRTADWPPGRLFTKPFDLEELAAKLEEILRHWPEI